MMSTVSVSSVPSSAKTPTTFRLGYRRWLDGMRGIAVLMVLAFHLGLIQGGWLGVDIFFVLSGFLITTLLAQEWQKNGSISFRAFYMRRALRLFPALFSLFLVTYVCTRLFRSPDEALSLRREIVVAACYVSNWPSLHGIVLPTLGHTWSLSVEEQFYLLWPVLLFLLLRSGLSRRGVILIVCAGMLTSAVLRDALHRARPRTEPERGAYVFQMYTGLHTRADTLLVGCVVGLLATGNLLPKTPRFRFRTGLAALGSVVILGVMLKVSGLDHSQFYHGLFTAVALMVGVILVRLLSGPVRFVSPLLESRVLVGVGRISYSLYLVHIPIIHWLHAPALGWSAPGMTLLAGALSLAAAIVLYFCIERPCLRLKDRLHSPEPVAAAVEDRRPIGRRAA
jgi:peptidoglycan/LPS O-acetylase OafA/YrhL